MRSAARVLAGLLVVSAGAVAQAQGERGGVRAQDRRFIREAAQGGQAEVRLGQLAMRRGQMRAVRQFGQRMVHDHGRANQELRDRALSEGLRLPGGIGPHAAVYNRLARLSGSSFDRAYMAQMVEDHRRTIDLFQAEVRGGGNPSFREFARNSLPALREHLRMAREMARAVGAPRVR